MHPRGLKQTGFRFAPGSQNYAVHYTNYDMPIVRAGKAAERSSAVILAGGETGRVAVTMQKRGVDALTH